MKAVLPSPLKVVHLQLFSNLTGVQKVSYDEFSSMLKLGFQIEYLLICKDKGPLTIKAQALGVRCIQNKWMVRNINPFADLIALIRLIFILIKEKPHVIHTHSSKTGILGRLAGFLASVPVIIHTVHGFSFPFAKSTTERKFYEIVEYFAAKITTYLIVLNDDDYKIATNLLELSKNKVLILPNAVNQNIYSPIKLNVANYDAGEKAIFRLGIIGRLVRQKNQQLAIKAFASLDENIRSRCEIILIGDGEDQCRLRILADELGVSNQIKFNGWSSDIPRDLQNLDVVLMPSLWEGMPLALLEAMSSGVPIIASDIPGNRSLIRHEVTGLLFRSDDFTDLASKISQLLTGSELRAAIIKNALDVIRDKHSLESRTRILFNLYESTFINSHIS